MKPSEQYLESIRVEKIATKEDVQRLLKSGYKELKEGDIYYLTEPEPQNFTEYWERFTRLKAQVICEYHIEKFEKNYGDGNERIVRDELQEIESFIEAAEQISTKAAFEHRGTDIRKEYDNQCEYLKLTYDYYNLQKFGTCKYYFFGSNANWVYGKYVLYREWLNDALEKYKQSEFDPFNGEYNGMFAVSSEKQNLKDRETNSLTKRFNRKTKSFDLRNESIYYKDTGQLIESGKQSIYNTEFLIRLSNLYALEVHNYLTHHMKGSKAPDELYKFIKYAALHSEIVKHEGIKQAVRDWLKEYDETTALAPVHEVEEVEESENNVLHSTIEDWLHPFKEERILVGAHYDTLVHSLIEYTENKKFPENIEPIKVGKVNVKRFGWAINEILRSENISIDMEVLRFAKKYISIYADVEINEVNFRKGNLYKYFTTKTQ